MLVRVPVVESVKLAALAEGLSLLRVGEVPRAHALWLEADGDVVGREIAIDHVEIAPVLSEVLEVDAPVQGDSVRAAQDRCTAGERDPTEVEAATRVVDHYRRARVVLEVAGLTRLPARREEQRAAVPEEPHADEVDAAVGVQGGEVRDQTRAEQLLPEPRG
jgi:hypothetical protein